MNGSTKAAKQSSNGASSEGPSYCRLSVTISRKVANDLASVRERDNVTATDAVNRAISTYRYLQKRIDEGARVLLADENGMYEIVFQ